MEITHNSKNLRIAPRKLRLAADAVKHMSALPALNTLKVTNQKGAQLIAKSLKSAIQTAIDNSIDEETLVLQRVFCGEGIKLKRYIGHSHGRMARIIKHSSHLTIVLKGETKVAKRKAVKATDPSNSMEANNNASNEVILDKKENE